MNIILTVKVENILVALTREIGDGPCFLYIKFSWTGVEPLISCPFLSSKLDSPVIKTLERHSLNVQKVSLQYFDYRMKEMAWATDQRFILKEITS